MNLKNVKRLWNVGLSYELVEKQITNYDEKTGTIEYFLPSTGGTGKTLIYDGFFTHHFVDIVDAHEHRSRIIERDKKLHEEKIAYHQRCLDDLFIANSINL